MKENPLDIGSIRARCSEEEFKARESFVISGKIPIPILIRKGFRSLCLDPVLFTVRNLPGEIGFKTRQMWYKCFLGAMGKGCIIDVGVSFSTPYNVFLDRFVFIDQYCQFLCPEGYIRIGKRSHIAQFCVILGHSGVEIGNFVGIAAGSKILSLSDWPGNGKRICGPMVPIAQRGLRAGQVTIENEASIGANSVIMPGVTIGEGAVVAANSVVSKDVKPWTIVMGIPPRVIGKRDPVTQPDPDLLQGV
jgi:acetyltransferase-like isoleucine patch superfamily enzyme